MNTRLAELFLFLKAEPKDPFTLYAIALEYMKTDEKQALLYFQKLLDEHENYVPTYYQLAKLYEELEEIDKAKDIYQKGLKISQLQNEKHTYKELEKAYQQLLRMEDF